MTAIPRGTELDVLGSTYRFLVGGEEVGGRFSLAEETFWGDPPPLHVHEQEEEAFYVLSGRGRVVVGNEVVEVSAGSFVLVPRGVPHTLERTTDQPLRMLTTVTPAGFEGFFAEVAAWPGGADAMGDDDLVELAARYHCRFV